MNGKLNEKLNSYFGNNIKFACISKLCVYVLNNHDDLYKFNRIRKESFSNLAFCLTNDGTYAKELIENCKVERLCGKDLIKIEIGLVYSVGLTEDNKAYVWAEDYSPKETRLINFIEIENVIDLSCGFRQVMLLRNNKEVYSLDDNGFKSIKNNNYEESMGKKHVSDENIEFISISCGSYHTLAMTENGQVYGWGYFSP